MMNKLIKAFWRFWDNPSSEALYAYKGSSQNFVEAAGGAMQHYSVGGESYAVRPLGPVAERPAAAGTLERILEAESRFGGTVEIDDRTMALRKAG